MSFIHEDRDFNDLLRIVAKRHGLPVGLVEKDYWVTHVLWAIHNQGFDVWFKGGTSLSKGFELIKRFSEDLDLKIDPGPVGRAAGLRGGSLHPPRRIAQVSVVVRFVQLLLTIAQLRLIFQCLNATSQTLFQLLQFELCHSTALILRRRVRAAAVGRNEIHTIRHSHSSSYTAHVHSSRARVRPVMMSPTMVS